MILAAGAIERPHVFAGQRPARRHAGGRGARPIINRYGVAAGTPRGRGVHQQRRRLAAPCRRSWSAAGRAHRRRGRCRAPTCLPASAPAGRGEQARALLTGCTAVIGTSRAVRSSDRDRGRRMPMAGSAKAFACDLPRDGQRLEPGRASRRRTIVGAGPVWNEERSMRLRRPISWRPVIDCCRRRRERRPFTLADRCLAARCTAPAPTAAERLRASRAQLFPQALLRRPRVAQPWCRSGRSRSSWAEKRQGVRRLSRTT